MEERLTIDSFEALLKAAKLIQERIKQVLVSCSLSLTEFSVLDVLYQKGKQPVHQICNSVLLASGSMTYVIDKLEQRSLLKRCDCQEDRRVVHVMITDEGTILMDKIFPEYQKLIQEIFGEITLEEKRTMIRVLRKLTEKANKQI